MADTAGFNYEVLTKMNAIGVVRLYSETTPDGSSPSKQMLPASLGEPIATRLAHP